MTDDEINDLIIEHYATSGEVNDVVTFARAVAAKEREACAAIVDAEMEVWDTPVYVIERLDNVSKAIKARSKNNG